MAESIHEGTLISLHAQVGTWIDVDGDLGDIETDKVNVPITCPEAGTIVELMVAAGDLVKVGQAVAVLETDSGTKSHHRGREIENTSAAQEPTVVHEPVLGANGGLTEELDKQLQRRSSAQAGEKSTDKRPNEKSQRVVSLYLLQDQQEERN